MKKSQNIILNIFFTLLLIAIISGTYFLYKRFYFGEFTKAQTSEVGANFYREKEAFCLENTEYNDTLFYKKINVDKNTAYRVTYKVKTENVKGRYEEKEISENDCYKYQIGAVCGIMDTTESSESVAGNTDWKEMNFIFYSKNREDLKIYFRLGGYMGEAIGKASFKDFKIEKAKNKKDINWNVVCFNIENIDATLGGKNYKISMTKEDKELVKDNLNSFKNTMKDFSQGKMTVTTNIIDIKEPLKTLSYTDQDWYYIDPNDVYNLIDKYVQSDKYDHIFIATRMGDKSLDVEIPVKDWIGLGGMRYRDIGFSNIRMPSDMKTTVMYKYNTRYNVFPEEVFVHEFLHTLERNLKEYDVKFPELHNNEAFGYEDEGTSSIKVWYRDYMRQTVKGQNGYTGLTDIVYTTMPRHNEDFKDCEEIEFKVEPSNFFEGVVTIIANLFKNKGLNDNLSSNTNENNTEVVHFNIRKEETE